MSDDRLVVCPECDELVVEDDWDIHKARCRDLHLYEMGEHDFLDTIERRRRHDPYWWQDYDELDRAVEDSLNDYLARGADVSYYGHSRHHWWTRQFHRMLPAERITDMFKVNMPNTGSLQWSATTNTVEYDSIVVKLPPGLEPRLAKALIREQLTDQWRSPIQDV